MISAPGHAGTVYLVDDDPTILKLLQTLVATIDAEARPFSSATEFLSAYRPLPCECLVCDLRMPSVDGMALQDRLIAMHSTVPIIFLTGYAEVDVAVEAMRHGAFDFLEKPFGAQALLKKIQAALALSQVEYHKRREKETQEARIALLTPREREVIQRVVNGKSSREIAEQLELSVRTVENHRTRIMEKLHVVSTVELVKLFM